MLFGWFSDVFRVLVSEANLRGCLGVGLIHFFCFLSIGAK